MHCKAPCGCSEQGILSTCDKVTQQSAIAATGSNREGGQVPRQGKRHVTMFVTPLCTLLSDMIPLLSGHLTTRRLITVALITYIMKLCLH